jgi:teichuronic acid biosynthesis glycosyltransferase TuaG
MSAEPVISVVTPVHNGSAWLAEAIKSVLAQTLTEFELLVVDDGSTDASPDIAAAFSNQDSRVRLIRLPRRQGLISALLEPQKARSGRHVSVDRLLALELSYSGLQMRALQLSSPWAAAT